MTTPPPRSPSDMPTFAAGRVTTPGVGGPPPAWPVPDVIAAGPPPRTSSGRALLWYGGAAGLILVTGVIVLLTMFLGGRWGGETGPLSSRANQPPDLRPPLARLCPAPTSFAESSTAPVAPPAPGPRTIDERAGISYAAYEGPWLPFDTVWRAGTLEVAYAAGQHFVTETYPLGLYEASILSAAVPATVNDSTAIDLVCTGQQVAADVQAEYYPGPNTRDVLREELTTLGGRPAWLTTFRLHFDEPGLTAKSELVGVALIDVGRPTAAVIYISIPDTHRLWEHIVDEVLASVRPL